MKQGLAVARALINRPDLLLPDEPTAGLDPQAATACAAGVPAPAAGLTLFAGMVGLGALVGTAACRGTMMIVGSAIAGRRIEALLLERPVPASGQLRTMRVSPVDGSRSSWMRSSTR